MQRTVGGVEVSWGAGLLSVVQAGPAGVLAIWGPQPSSALAPRPCLLASAFPSPALAHSDICVPLRCPVPQEYFYTCVKVSSMKTSDIWHGDSCPPLRLAQTLGPIPHIKSVQMVKYPMKQDSESLPQLLPKYARMVNKHINHKQPQNEERWKGKQFPPL